MEIYKLEPSPPVLLVVGLLIIISCLISNSSEWLKRRSERIFNNYKELRENTTYEKLRNGGFLGSLSVAALFIVIGVIWWLFEIF